MDQYHSRVKELLETRGSLGVNALSQELKIPLSTLQKYMHKQDYFVITEQRKWDLPENVVVNSMKESVKDFDTVIDSQLTGITALSDMLQAQIKAAITLLHAQKPIRALPVANSVNIDQSLIALDKRIKEAYAVFKKYMPVVPEEYKDLLKNVDMYKITIKYGSEFLNGDFNEEITALFLEKSTELSEDTIELLKDNQKS